MHHSVPEFDLIRSPLSGSNLIEASAGTGKTFTITGIYLRLLLEKRLTVDQILVVTFTEAATNELKARIRGVLHGAKKILAGARFDDPFLTAYLSSRPPAPEDTAIADAIRDFDEAAIFTIHGFCNRILREYAFESRGLFDTELVTEQSELLLQIVEDFWRLHLYDESRLFLGYAAEHISPNALFDLLLDKVGQPYLKIIPTPDETSSEPLEVHYASSFQLLRRSWEEEREEVSEILIASPALNRNYYRKKNIPDWLNAMATYLAPENPVPVLPAYFEKFTTSYLATAVKKGGQAPDHAFFRACQAHHDDYRALDHLYSRRLIGLKIKLFDFARTELKRRKQDKNVNFFDDLLLNLHQALSHNVAELPMAIRSKFKAALIDEFQDTDPVQYDIFKRIFLGNSSILFVIGDPKQSIYGFRGADIFAYIQAKHEIANQFTLSRNHRSQPRLIEAINSLFGGVKSPFIYDAIPYNPASAAETKVAAPLVRRGKEQNALSLWFLTPDRGGRGSKPLAMAPARAQITESVATEIMDLVQEGRQGQALVADHPLQEKDIAVLVRTNAEARQIQDALTARHVHSVLYSSANLFESEETLELERILYAVLEPKRERLLKAALATQIIGLDGEALFALDQDEPAMSSWFDKFSRYHELWHDHGFMRMFRRLVSEEELLPRLMTFPDGARRLTNLLHLGELLNEAEVNQGLGMSGLLKWLWDQRSAGTAPLEEHQLRLESDENAVKIVTMHMSKGLEYPVVFCPFTWLGSFVHNADTFTFHDETQDQAFTLDLGSNDKERNRRFAENEELSENLRLMYVALTRARSASYLVWGRFNRSESSAPAYLFHQSEVLASEDRVQTLSRYVRSLDDDRMRQEVADFVKRAGETIELSPPPATKMSFLDAPDVPQAILTCRDFGRRMVQVDTISSYSSIATRLPHAEEIPDHDLQSLVVPPRDPEVGLEEFSSFLAFPRGAKSGLFIHDVLQYIDFAGLDQEQSRELIRQKLHAYGFSSDWLPAVTQMLRHLCARPIGFEPDLFTLSQIGESERLNELAFYFSLRSVSAQSLREIFARHSRSEGRDTAFDSIEELNFARLQGFMKGFIDLVFVHKGRYYVVDWKSNDLGNQLAQYDRTRMAAAMSEGLYTLQYHIYVVALNRYLQLRVPGYDYDTHFGGVLYLFLRGFSEETRESLGVFSARPTAALIAELSQKMATPTHDSPEIRAK